MFMWYGKTPTTGNGDIYFKKSVDNGISFGNIENLSNNTSFSDSFYMAISGSNVYVVWTIILQEMETYTLRKAWITGLVLVT